jgi:hypothetical protein
MARQFGDGLNCGYRPLEACFRKRLNKCLLERTRRKRTMDDRQHAGTAQCLLHLILADVTILAEELSLALDPYPRARDADRHLAEFGGDGGSTRSPFGALAGLRRH